MSKTTTKNDDGSGSEVNSRRNEDSHEVRTTKIDWDSDGKHETTFTKAGPDKNEEGWHGKDYDKSK